MGISYKNLFAYAVLALPIAVLGVPLYIYIPTYYVTDLHLQISDVGLALFFARSLDIISDPLIGKLSDKMQSRKTMIMAGSVLMLGGFYFLIHPFLQPSALYLCVLSILTYLGWSLVNIPYLALSAEIGEEGFDTTRLSFAREIAMIVGLLIALSIPYFAKVSQDTTQSLGVLFTYLLFILPTTLAFFALFLSASAIKRSESKFFESLRTFFVHFPKFKRLIAAYFLNSLANSFPATLFLLYVSLVLGSAKESSLLLMSYFLSGVIAFPMWIALAKRYDNGSLWITSMLLASGAFIFVPFLGSGDSMPFLLICLVSGFSLGADMALPSAIQADIAIESERGNNELTGVLFGMWAMVTKLSLAFGTASAFFILGLVGFDDKTPTYEALLTLSLLYSLLPVALKFLSIFFIFRYKR